VNAEHFLDALQVAGVRLCRDGGDLFADVLPGVDIAPYVDRIRTDKLALLAALALREEIIAAATIAPAHFDRTAYDAHWRDWYTLAAQEIEP
jgi:hypothetical protein